MSKQMLKDTSSTLEDLSNVLYRSPNLQSLNTILSNLTDSLLITRKLTPSLVLSRLKLTSSVIQITTLEYLLEIFPNLISLYLEFCTKSSKLISSQYWIDIFEKNPQLKYVYIRITIKLLDTNFTHEQVRERVKLLERPLFFTRMLINRLHIIRIIINGTK